MSENISSIDPTLQGGDSSIGDMAESQARLAARQVWTPKVGGVSPSVTPKKFPFFSVILLLILSVVSVISVYLFLQVRELSISQPVPTPTPTPEDSADPTGSWSSYLLEPIGLTLKYPDKIEVSDDVVNSTEFKGDYEYFVAYPGTDQIFLDIILYKSSKTPLNWWDTVGKKIFERIAKDDEKYMNLPVDIQLSYEINSILLDNQESLSVKILSNYITQQIPKVNNLIIFQKNGYIVTIKYSKFSEDSLRISTQILSTFKFTDSTMPYTCPASGYVDCMPSPDGPKPSCTKKAMDWYKANCPDFKGAAL